MSAPTRTRSSHSSSQDQSGAPGEGPFYKDLHQTPPALWVAVVLMCLGVALLGGGVVAQPRRHDSGLPVHRRRRARGGRARPRPAQQHHDQRRVMVRATALRRGCPCHRLTPTPTSTGRRSQRPADSRLEAW